MADRNLAVMQQLIDDVSLPAAVRADLLKFVVKVAGLDASAEQKAAANVGSGLTINLNLG